MENSEILDFQFEATKSLQPNSSSIESWKTCLSADREPSTTRQKEASVDTWCVGFNCSQTLLQPATKECLCYYGLNACEYFKIKRYMYLLAN